MSKTLGYILFLVSKYFPIVLLCKTINFLFKKTPSSTELDS